MPFILVNHDSFISDGPVLVKLQVDGFDDIGIGLDVGFLAVRPETDAAAVTENVKNETPKKARGDRRCRPKFRKLGHRDSATPSLTLGKNAPVFVNRS